jgi:hypothetical protein
MTSAEWREWLRPRLGGAVSCATISGPEALRLPELSPEKIAMVRDSNPDTIVVLGAELSVEYREPYYGTAKSPQITLGGEFVSSNRWIGLPDEGVRLPSGRAVNIVLKSASSYYALAEGSDIPILKKTMKDRLNEEAWKSFTDRPAITAPDLSDENVTLPEIATAVYGTCAVTGESLLAYGTITAYRSWSLDPVTWKAEWFRSRVDAESASGKAQAELEKSKVEAREKRLVAAARVAAEESQKNAGELYNRYCGDGSDVALGEELREKLYSRRYSRLPLTADELVRWKAETDAMIAEVEASVTAAIAKKAELEKRRLAGDLLLDFGGHFRVMGATARFASRTRLTTASATRKRAKSGGRSSRRTSWLFRGTRLIPPRITNLRLIRSRPLDAPRLNSRQPLVSRKKLPSAFIRCSAFMDQQVLLSVLVGDWDLLSPNLRRRHWRMQSRHHSMPLPP